MEKTISINCEECKNNYSLLERRYKVKVKKETKHFFCSYSCHLAFRRKNMVNNCSCLNCKKEFYRAPSTIEPSGNIFCSQSCSATWNNTGKQKNPSKERICSKCKAIFFRFNDHKSSFCVNCKGEGVIALSTRTLKECQSQPSLVGKHPSWKNVLVRSHNQTFNSRLKKLPCQLCGYDKHTELAHIKPISAFSEDDKLGEINSSDNILVLCRNHHWEFDHGHLSLEDIPKRK